MNKTVSIIICNHVNFSKRTSKYYCNRIGLECTEDIESMGFVGLIKAATSHVPDRLTFKSWAAFKIRSEIRSYIKGQVGTKKGQCHREAVIVPFEENVEDKKRTVEERLCVKEELKVLLKKIPKRWREVLRLHYFVGLSLKEIGDINGYTRANASRIKRDAISKMRNRKEKL